MKFTVVTHRVFMATAFVALAGAAHAQPNQLTIVSGSPGGSWYPIAAGMSAIFGREGIRSNAETGAGVTNMIQVSMGQAELGVTTSTIPPMAEAGEAPFEQTLDNNRALATLFPNAMHIAVTDDSGIATLDDLVGMRINTTAVGNSTQQAFVDVLTAAGIEESEVETSRGSQNFAADAVKDGSLDGLVLLSAYPNGTYTELFSSVDMNLLSLDEEILAALGEANPGYSPSTIPAGTYPGQDDDVATARSDLILFANQDMSDEDAHWIVSTLLNHMDELQGIHAIMSDLTPDTMANVQGMPLHPGALEAYSAAGIAIPDAD
ncbi:TAXI family TRAP transporter solute-binding subunit [Fodinicurvata sp. EGI_FJ10296]|uniref:TAXI family TRAP transporter solute-binding subunit n=1 Tax=Fodinicurvata sp. EGI_FJ10296 TaxID=3231908 RepID=UPI00345513BE